MTWSIDDLKLRLIFGPLKKKSSSYSIEFSIESMYNNEKNNVISMKLT